MQRREKQNDERAIVKVQYSMQHGGRSNKKFSAKFSCPLQLRVKVATCTVQRTLYPSRSQQSMWEGDKPMEASSLAVDSQRDMSMSKTNCGSRQNGA